MKSVCKPLLLAGILASTSFVALSQLRVTGRAMMALAPHAPGMGHAGVADRSRPVQARIEKRLAVLKAQLS